MNRLEAMSKEFRQRTFGEYMKEYDIFTGDKKTRLNEKRLQEEENTYVRNMEAMVAGRALKVNPFTKAQVKRMAQVANNAGNRAREDRPKSAGAPNGQPDFAAMLASITSRTQLG